PRASRTRPRPALTAMLQADRAGARCADRGTPTPAHQTRARRPRTRPPRRSASLDVYPDILKARRRGDPRPHADAAGRVRKAVDREGWTAVNACLDVAAAHTQLQGVPLVTVRAHQLLAHVSSAAVDEMV